MKWVLRVLSLLFFLAGFVGFKQIDGIILAFRAGLISEAIGRVIGAILIWWLFALLLWILSCRKVKKDNNNLDIDYKNFE